MPCQFGIFGSSRHEESLRPFGSSFPWTPTSYSGVKLKAVQENEVHSVVQVGKRCLQDRHEAPHASVEASPIRSKSLKLPVEDARKMILGEGEHSLSSLS